MTVPYSTKILKTKKKDEFYCQHVNCKHKRQRFFKEKEMEIADINGINVKVCKDCCDKLSNQ